MHSIAILFLTATCVLTHSLDRKVKNAFKEAHDNMEMKDILIEKYMPKHSNKPESQKASPSSHLEQLRGDLLLEVTKIMVKKNGMKILPDLEKRDLKNFMDKNDGIGRKKRAVTASSCAPESRDCTRDKNFGERSITGVCNNIDRKDNGAALTFFRRLKGRASYGDGLGSVRTKSVTSSPLPSPRFVSNQLNDKIGKTRRGQRSGCRFTYVVGRENTCGWVALNNGMSERDLQRINPTLECSRLFSGQRLCVFSDPAKRPNCYTKRRIRRGDYCSRIARINHLSVSQLIEFNPKLDCFNLPVGYELCLEKPETKSEDVKTAESSDTLDPTTSHFHMQFGQFIAHDIVITPSAVDQNGDTLDCSSCNSARVTDNCAPIKVPNDDQYFPPNSCIRLTRAINGQKAMGQREQMNQNTHYLDLSPVYGSEECEAAAVRSFRNGQLKTFDRQGYTLPPQDTNDTLGICQSRDPAFCFVAGDLRNSFHPSLLSLHVVYIKEHNRIARAFKNANPRLTDEQIFQQTRRIVIAQHVHHVYNSYLPKVLGTYQMREFDLFPRSEGFYRGYDPALLGSASIEFCVGSFRFGHSQIPKDIKRFTNNNRTKASSIDYGSHFFYTEPVYEKKAGGTESILDGICQNAADKVDFHFSFPVRNQMFEIREKPASGIDLIAVNMMRGRDVGLFPYNEYRELAGRPRAASFKDLEYDMGAENVEALKHVYAHVDDIDLYPGILMETPLPGAQLGRVGSWMVAETFDVLKRGDRWYYENFVIGTRGLTPDELTAVRNSRLEKVVCDSSSVMEMVNKNIFEHGGPRIRCDSMSSIDLRPFLNNGINPF